jgi:hypothetical protein
MTLEEMMTVFKNSFREKEQVETKSEEKKERENEPVEEKKERENEPVEEKKERENESLVQSADELHCHVLTEVADFLQWIGPECAYLPSRSCIGSPHTHRERVSYLLYSCV